MLEVGSLEDNGEHSGVGCTEISKIPATQGAFFFGTAIFLTEYNAEAENEDYHTSPSLVCNKHELIIKSEEKTQIITHINANIEEMLENVLLTISMYKVSEVKIKFSNGD